MKVLNFGSLNLDRTYEVTSFTKSGETVMSHRYSEFLGGKGLNQSVALKRAGCEVHHIGMIGKDGARFRDFMQQEEIDSTFLFESTLHSGHAVVQINEAGDNCILVEAGANQQLTYEHVDHALAAFGQEVCIVLLQNEIANVAYIVKRAKEAGHIVVLNPSPITSDLMEAPLHGVDYLILNEHEAMHLAGIRDKENMFQALRLIYPDTIFVVTLGSEGAVYDDGQQVVFQPAFPVTAVDTTAAGDTFTGYFISGLIHRSTIQEALKSACAASSLAIQSKGAVNSIPVCETVYQKMKEEAI